LTREAIADIETAIRVGIGTDFPALPAKVLQGVMWLELGRQPRRALDAFPAVEKEADRPGSKGFLFVARRGVAQATAAMGDAKLAEPTQLAVRTFTRSRKSPPMMQINAARFRAAGVGYQAPAA
jgi:hypothetical protein